MAGARLPIAVAHGEGRAEFGEGHNPHQVLAAGTVALRYVDNRGAATEHYPYNPNGSVHAVTGEVSGRAIAFDDLGNQPEITLGIQIFLGMKIPAGQLAGYILS